jgi:hypothetical protein
MTKAVGHELELSWQSGFDRGTGSMHARVPDGTVYDGEFFQIRALLGTDTTGAYFVRWVVPAWAEDPWYGGFPQQCVGANSNKMVARLLSKHGATMRCRLELRKPERGLSGGAFGLCEFAAETFAVDL